MLSNVHPSGFVGICPATLLQGWHNRRTNEQESHQRVNCQRRPCILAIPEESLVRCRPLDRISDEGGSGVMEEVWR
ncbi:hypothetical protein EVAR_14538_1 [Eumeta japonica]|uniref:Uncharacterized protein n=1 Tax=Eumeta variegata TaxID=151549 RepID=A0A4C1U3B2_EUMVA|nr:hypothetical protein EVAR_14538_1 [Eumeta japonica]